MRCLKPAALMLAAFSLPAAAQDAGPADPALPSAALAVPEPSDSAYPGGAMTIEIDASDILRGTYRVTQTIPLAPGTDRLTLLFPEWLPGHHAPRGPIAELVGMQLLADGRPVTWRRDPLDVYAFHVALPSGSRELVAKFAHTSPLQPSEGRVTMTPEMLNLQWEKMSLYPAGHYVRRVRVRPSVILPAGWTAATALTGKSRSGNRVTWAETDYETLVDSPIFAGAYFRKWDLGHSVDLNVVADTPELLSLGPTGRARLEALVDEALIAFGRPPFDHYDFLVALSQRLGGIGLEHLESSENQLEPENFVDWKGFDWDRNVLAHELVHSWNGKYRRPAGLWTPDYRQPMRDNLLWVYEGQTQFWGWVLAARSGLQSKETVLGMIARSAGALAEQPGRTWRSVEDTTLDPIIAARKPKPYQSFARGEDYYAEGALIWLEADQIIRTGTGGRKGLDDFARAFFAHSGGEERVRTYTFEDIVAALNAVHPYGWAEFLRRRVEESGREPPLAGIEEAGYELVWKDEPNPYEQARMDHHRHLNLTFSLGLLVDDDGVVLASHWDGPAFRAGIVTGTRIVAVNTLAFTPDVLKRAITDAKDGKRPIELLVRRGEHYLTIPVAYHGGLRWPWLEPKSRSGEAPLDRLLTARRDGTAR